MHLLSRSTLIASMTKHDLAGTVIVIIAIALLVGAGTQVVAKAAKAALTLVLLGVLAAVVAVLLFTRAV